MNKNPIGKVGLFATPKSMERLQDYMEKFNGPEGTVANTCAFMAWNLASKIIDDILEEEAAEAERLLAEAVDRLKGVLTGDDGQAYKKAEKFLDRFAAIRKEVE
jgi:hypothetical protein